MIHHVSIPAREPRRVAEVLAELMGGRVFPFAPVAGAFMAASGDEHGTMIEVYPDAAAMLPGAAEEPVTFTENDRPPQSWPFHVLLSVALDEDQVTRIGEREGWRAKRFGRGLRDAEPFFDVIEFWIENRLMIEIATPEMARGYQQFLQFSRLEPMQASGPAQYRVGARA